MDYSSKATSIAALKMSFKTDTFNFNHPLQRKEGQWNKLQKSEFIDSLFRRYPINPIYVIKNEKLDVIDGLQRLTNIRDFLNDELRLSDKLSPVIINGSEVGIAGMKFSELGENTQAYFLAAEIEIYTLIDCTDEDIIEIFRRQNAGTPLSKTQKSIVYLSEGYLGEINKILENEFWSKTALTDRQIKKDEDRDIVVQTLALMHDGENIGDLKNYYLYEVFSNKFEKLAKDKQKNYFSRLNFVAEKMNEALDKKEKNLKKVTIPVALYGLDYCKQNGKDIDKYIEWLKGFLTSYDIHEEYRSYCVSASASKENVLKRKGYFDEAIASIQ